MATNFKKQVSQRRPAVPQVDPEGAKAAPIVPPHMSGAASAGSQSTSEQASGEQFERMQPQALTASIYHITLVDTSEAPVNRGFFMYPSRHRQVAKDLAYIEDRNPWQIIEDALEEYVAKHYGEEYKRK